MKNILMLISGLIGFTALNAQDPSETDTLWKYHGVTSLNISQISLSNWAAGGENSVSGNALVQISADYDNGTMNWDNDLIMGFGLIRQGNDPTRKSDDKFDISSKFGFRASKNWFYSGLVGFRTQFTEGYDRPGDVDRIKISNWLAPGYINVSAGMDFKPNEEVSLLIAPLTGKITFVRDKELSATGSFGLAKGETAKGEFGSYIKFAFKKEVLKHIFLDTKVDFFSNYLENPQYVDINWDLLLTFKVNEYISASLVTQLIYDRDIEFGFDTSGDGAPDTYEPRVQLKELFGIGFSYTF